MTQHEREQKIARAQSGTARASVLGLSDGLVTNVALILGVAGANASPIFVRVAGAASLIAGACSMAVGEYISMRSQVELLSSVLELEREEFEQDPDTARDSVSALLTVDGVGPKTAAAAAEEIMSDKNKALTMYIRQRFGLNANELGAAWGSAISSFITFSIGALIPLAPWFITSGTAAVAASLLCSAVSALLLGGYLGYATNGRWLKAALRQLFVLVLAAGATYLIGRLFHTHVT